MTRTHAAFANFAPGPPQRATSVWWRLIDAARNHHAFKSQPEFRLRDMGLTRSDQEAATFAEFVHSPAYDRGKLR
ncbi:MAG: hypothetical protein OIF48_05110 [Silicimonas sp.]|nr:hypothetical protein [Silicimonas sp.]